MNMRCLHGTKQGWWSWLLGLVLLVGLPMQSPGAYSNVMERHAFLHDNSTRLTSGTSYFPAYDGNGNILALVNAADGSVAAQYQYSPFGELIRSTGTMAKANPFRWSTKYWDEETGLVYYGYRYYSPTMGRWISRDPAEENGGINLYGFVGNSPLNNNDRVGLSMYEIALERGGVLGGSDEHQLASDLQLLIDVGAMADSITIKGHGTPDVITMANNTFITATVNGQILDQDGNDMTDLFRSVMASGGFINLAGCQTGRGSNNIAMDFSSALPGITVCGGAGRAQFGIPYILTTIGKKNYYINGNRANSTW